MTTRRIDDNCCVCSSDTFVTLLFAFGETSFTQVLAPAKAQLLGEALLAEARDRETNHLEAIEERISLIKQLGLQKEENGYAWT